MEVTSSKNVCDCGNLCNRHHANFCSEHDPSGIWVCTMEKNHPGNHIACYPSNRNDGHNCCSWNDTDIKED